MKEQYLILISYNGLSSGKFIRYNSLKEAEQSLIQLKILKESTYRFQNPNRLRPIIKEIKLVKIVEL